MLDNIMVEIDEEAIRPRTPKFSIPPFIEMSLFKVDQVLTSELSQFAEDNNNIFKMQLKAPK